MKKQYKNLVFDVGGVLLSYRWKQQLMDYGLSEAEALRVGNEMFEDPENLWEELDYANFSEEEVIVKYEKKYPKDAKVIRWFITHGEYMQVPRPQIWECLHELKACGYKIYLLSNYCEHLFERHTHYADFMKDIDGMLVSYMVHHIKPEKEIYLELFRRFDLNPKECLFFDDRPQNVEGGQRLGMDSILVESPASLLEQMESLK